mmetsp:Transcript_23829/g.26439  ORF Transcript_23829/g.26439 Transcript_23829/m.26439 type:complete len:143 (+) Transcript_23829:372-800(+)
MYTPSGRFKTDMRLCLSMSDYHPESWNPLWSVKSILIGLLSFMLEEAQHAGSLEGTTEARMVLAKKSLEWNKRSKKFIKMFPELAKKAKVQVSGPTNTTKAPSATTTASPIATTLAQPQNKNAYVAIALLVIAILVALNRLL